MKTTVLAEYKAKTSTGSSIHSANNHLPIRVNQMIVWMLNHPEFALGMVPRWNEIKADQQAFDDHAEGSAKNHGIEV
jgi:hypothetical protein